MCVCVCVRVCVCFFFSFLISILYVNVRNALIKKYKKKKKIFARIAISFCYQGASQIAFCYLKKRR